MPGNAILVNFAGGETSPKSRGRFDIQSYTSSCRKLVNYIAEVSGPARFRPGFRFVATTYNNQKARLVSFQVSDTRSLLLVFTPGFLSVFENEAPLDFVNSWGEAGAAYTVGSPYLEADLPGLNFAQSAGRIVFTHFRHPPYAMGTVDNRFYLSPISLTNSPFVAGPTLTVGHVAKATQGWVAITAGNVDETAKYTFAAVVGTTQINGGVYRLEVSGGHTIAGTVYPKAYLVDASTGAYVNTSAWTTYVSGGTATPDADHPISVAFYEGRLVYGGTPLRPRTLFLSRSPDANGGIRHDDFTGGTAADHACFFSLAPINGAVDYINWLGGTNKYLLVGTFGGAFRVSGGGVEEPITPSSINARQLDGYGCAPIPPAFNGSQVFYVQRGGETFRAVQYSVDSDDFSSSDLTLNADQIGYSPIIRATIQAARPDAVWLVREDGQLAGMTVQSGEKITGWHRHKIGGVDAKVLDAMVAPRPGAPDQLYIIAERTINGATKRYIEVLSDDVVYPDPEDFFTAESASDSDMEIFYDAVYRLQERYTHLDSVATYNGTSRATDILITPDRTKNVVGQTMAFQAYESYPFLTADLGSEIWVKPDPVTGLGGGRATITGFSGEEVGNPGHYSTASALVGEVFSTLVPYPVTNYGTVAQAGGWYMAVDTITGLGHLEGQRVAVVADGAVCSDGKTAEYPTVTVASGAIALTRNCAVVHVGLPYEGMLITHNLEMGGQTGPAQDKPRNLARMAIRFLNSLGCEFGTSLYRTEKIIHNSNKYKSDRPTPVFSGIKIVHNSDDWLPENREKNVVVVQKLPLPSVVQFIDVHYDVGDE